MKLKMEKEIIRQARKVAEPFRVNKGKNFRLRDVDPGDTLWLKAEDKPKAKEALATGVQALAELQDKLYAQDKWALLLIFQAMDAAGKDGAIKHVMSGVNPQGCQVHSFKAPSAEDLDHDYLWRCMKVLPNRGHIGIFNRSYYEETLVVRVHPEFLKTQKLPEELVTKQIWNERFDDIRHFEQYLTRNGVVVRKFFLHVSKKEQGQRFMERLEDPAKHWKFSFGDLEERKHWPAYQDAFENMLQHTSTRWAPWWVIPADHKWVTRALIANIITRSIDRLGVKFPEVSAQQLKRLAAASSFNFSSLTSGYDSLSEASVSITAAATTTRVNHLLSAGTTYHGAAGVAVCRIMSS